VRAPVPPRPAARASVKRAASLVAEKQLLSLVSGQPGGPLTDAEFLEELRTEAQRRGIAPPALVVDDCEDAVVVGGEAQQQTCGATSRGAALRRPQRQQRPRLRRRVPRARAARALPAVGEVVDDGDLTRKRAFLSRDEELELCAAVKVCMSSTCSVPGQLLGCHRQPGACLFTPGV
jgi:hypothetical protein